MGGKIIMSCGHEETDDRPGFYVIYGTHDSFDDGSYGPCSCSSHMCQECIDGLKNQGVPFFKTANQEREWLAKQEGARD